MTGRRESSLMWLKFQVGAVLRAEAAPVCGTVLCVWFCQTATTARTTEHSRRARGRGISPHLLCYLLSSIISCGWSLS